MADAVSVPPARVVLSTAAVYPEPTATAFDAATRLGYDGVELMVWTEPLSQSAAAVGALADEHGLPVVSVHAPCLLVTQRVWSPDPWERLRRSCDLAAEVGAEVVVVHPPFRWQRDYARGFLSGVADLGAEHGVTVAVENMYPWRAGSRVIEAYAPGWDVTEQPYDAYTLDLSHTAVSGDDALEIAERMGGRLAHLHLADGTGLPRDEHLVPGRGNQPCAELLEMLAEREWPGAVVLEVSTRKAKDHDERMADLAEALAFTRLHLASRAPAS